MSSCKNENVGKRPIPHDDSTTLTWNERCLNESIILEKITKPSLSNEFSMKFKNANYEKEYVLTQHH